jgi:hypothetical protein
MHLLRRVPTLYGELYVSKPVTLTLASQRLAWRVIQDVTLAVAGNRSLGRVYQISTLFLQKCHFTKFTYNLHATRFKHVLSYLMDYIGARIGIILALAYNFDPNP